MAVVREEIKNPVMDLKIDPELKALIPSIKPDELAALEQSILDEGCRDPLIVWEEEGILLDGHNRYEICTRLDIPFNALRYSIADRLEAEIWMRRNQAGRRNLTDTQRAANAACLVELETEKSKRERARKAITTRWAKEKEESEGEYLADTSSAKYENDEQEEKTKHKPRKDEQPSPHGFGFTFQVGVHCQDSFAPGCHRPRTYP